LEPERLSACGYSYYQPVASNDTIPLQNAPFCPIAVSGSNCNPRNTQCIPAVKIFAFLELKQKFAFFKGLDTEEGCHENRRIEIILIPSE